MDEETLTLADYTYQLSLLQFFDFEQLHHITQQKKYHQPMHVSIIKESIIFMRVADPHCISPFLLIWNTHLSSRKRFVSAAESPFSLSSGDAIEPISFWK